MSAATGPARPVPRRIRLALVAPLALVAGLGVLYAMGVFGKATPGECRGSAAAVARLRPLVHGEVAALALADPPRLAPEAGFKDADGAPRRLAEFRGRTVLLNLWATWCIPCRQEMPALDRLQARRAGPDFQVVAVNIDTARLDRPRKFLADAGVTSLPFYADASAGIFQTLRTAGNALGLPTTVLIDRNGCELGTMAGPAAWDSPDARALIDAATSPPESPG